MSTGKKIQPGILIHFRRSVALLIVFTFIFYSYVSADPFCFCCAGIDKKNFSPKKTESCCSSKTGEKKHHNCPVSHEENSAQDQNSCTKSCGGQGHLECRENNYSAEIVPIHELNIQNFLAKYILTSYSFLSDNTVKQKSRFTFLNELNSNIRKIPLTIPLRI